MAPQEDVLVPRRIKQPVSRKKQGSTPTATQPSTGTTTPAELVSAQTVNPTGPSTATSALPIDKSIFLRKFAENALLQVKEGNVDEYQKLIKVFSYSRTTAVSADKYTEEVTPWIPALAANVSSLSITYRELVTTILFSDWITCLDERFIHRYSTLILQILSAHPTWVLQAMPALTRWFVFGSRKIDDPALVSVVHDRLHALIKQVYRTIPTCGASLVNALAEVCPYKTAKANIQVLFLQNVLRCLEYAVGVRKDVLRMVLNHVIQIDVEVQVELEELESDDEENGEEPVTAADDEGVFQFDDDNEAGSVKRPDADTAPGLDSDSESDSGSDDDDDDSDSSDDEDDDGLGRAKYNAKKTVAKLDAVMSTIFAWLEKHCQLDLATNEMPESTSQMFLQFLDLFITIVLPTFKSRYTQFFLFYLCAQDAQYADVFLGTMMSNVGEPVRNSQDRTSNVEKIAAASYLGSFVARARFLSQGIVRNVVGVLVQWANTYLDWQEQHQEKAALGRSRRLSYAQAASGTGNSLHGDFERHSVFYAVTQAVLYLFCFRWRDMAESVAGGPVNESELDNIRWCQEVEGIQRVVFSKLNPLRACSSVVAQQFAMVASQTNFMFCYSVLQQNRRKNQETDTGASGAVASPDQILRAELDTFFPFDPMALPVSRNFIDGAYLEWQDVGGTADSGDEGSQQSDAEDDKKSDEEGDANEADVLKNMVAMSISPVLPLSAFADRAFDDQF
ncbi:DNA independent RNA polymerase I transcription factor [Coemansia interrupta]|uniref:DNA independent RNA polymerase I transcription factor n=1 Tax=Coemansia interrupta TaxID=1126814 RepID=A0A9W8H6H0_9FUNG|nr:DNA independent RNA polymerase I transcription factor [Coemansia interrupta]